MTHEKKWIFCSISINTFTNLIFNLLLMISHETYTLVVILGEIIIIFFEALLYFLMTDTTFKTCLKRSSIANIISAVVGYIILIILTYMVFL